MDVYIQKVGIALPSRRVSNQDIIDWGNLNIRAATIERIAGIQSRFWLEEGKAASDLGVEAILNGNIVEPSGALLVSTISPDYFTPNTSSRIKAKLSWKGRGPAVDINAACSGLIFALEQAISRIRGLHEKTQVVVATEVRSRYLNLQDRRTSFLFGDGACAFQLGTTKEEALFRILFIKSYTIASVVVDVWVPGGGSAQPTTQQSLQDKANTIQMIDGTRIEEKFNAAIQQYFVPDLKEEGICSSAIDYLVLHQANTVLLENVRLTLGLDKTQVINTFEQLGNTSSSSVGIALGELIKTKNLHPGQKVCCMTLAAGDHLGLMVLEVC